MSKATAREEKQPLILIVDDEPLLRSLLGRQLRQEGYEVHVEESGNKAVAFMERTVPDLIISDIRMPDGDGLHVLKTSKKLNRNIPVLMISGYTDIPEYEFFNFGASCLLHKPFQTPDLLQSIEKHLLPLSQRILVCEPQKKTDLEVRFLSDLDEAFREKSFYAGTGGFALYSNRLYGKGQDISFALYFKEEPLKGQGQILWVKKTEDHLPSQLGIEIIGLEDASLKRWLKFVGSFDPAYCVPGPF